MICRLKGCGNNDAFALPGPVGIGLGPCKICKSCNNYKIYRRYKNQRTFDTTTSLRKTGSPDPPSFFKVDRRFTATFPVLSPYFFHTGYSGEAYP